MRIISKDHDYYDVVQAQGQDQTLLYLRKSEEVEIEGAFPFPTCFGRYSRYSGKVSPGVYLYIVGFCGRIYPVLHFSTTKYTPQYGEVKAVCFTLEEVDAFIEANYREKEVKEYKSKPKHFWRTRFWASDYLRMHFEKFFAKCENQKDAFQQMFMERHCPIFVAYHRGWSHGTSGIITWNASLKEHEFFRVFDPYQAFQEISMFLGSMAVPLKPIPEVPDKVMVEAKGFDKWSFRKPPREKR